MTAKATNNDLYQDDVIYYLTKSKLRHLITMTEAGNEGVSKELLKEFKKRTKYGALLQLD